MFRRMLGDRKIPPDLFFLVIVVFLRLGAIYAPPFPGACSGAPGPGAGLGHDRGDVSCFCSDIDRGTLWPVSPGGASAPLFGQKTFQGVQECLPVTGGIGAGSSCDFTAVAQPGHQVADSQGHAG